LFWPRRKITLRFYTDSQTLSVITIKDSFLIPTLDKLIDELFKAQFFFKLDLQNQEEKQMCHGLV